MGSKSLSPTRVAKKHVSPNVVGLTPSSGASENLDGSRVEVKKTGSNWQLFRNGEPYYIQGSGGAGNEGPISLLAAVGGNSTRTWGADDKSIALLDKAHENGLSVTMGIWLEHERLGMDYTDYDKVTEQIDLTLSHVKRLKNHPAILIWGIGNEMEGEGGDNPAIWSHIEHLAQLIKAEDPNHPVMTVIAEMGGRKIEAIHKLCPSVDIIGINSYGGGRTVPERYRDLGGTKPYIVTEFGPQGTWEVGKNSFGAINEKTSTAKVDQYRASYTAFKNDQQFCLGSYAFLWGSKQEGTATWFGMLTPDGKKTAAVDLMSEFWTGKKPENLCPRIQDLSLEGPDTVDANATVKLKLVADDPEGQPINVTWKVMAEAGSYVTGGDFQKAPPSFDDAIVTANSSSATVKLPEATGTYRVYAFVDDGANGAATANIPIRVQGKHVLAEASPKPEGSVVVYDEPEDEMTYAPSGYMGSVDSIALDISSQDDPKVGQHCLKCEFKRSDDWGGVVWQHPENDWGDKPGGFDLTAAKKLTFWTRSENGGEKIQFGFGVLGQDKKYFDTAKKEIEVTLETEWKQHEIDLAGLDLQRIKTGFFWSLAGQGQPVTFYLDRVVYE